MKVLLFYINRKGVDDMSEEKKGGTENRRRRAAVWVHEGTRTKNRLGNILPSLVAEAKKSGASDEAAFEHFADHPEVQYEIKNHPNESVRVWSRGTLIEAAKSRMKADMKLMLKRKDIPATTIDELPDLLPKSIFRRKVGKKQDVIADIYSMFGGSVEDGTDGK
jgi:hypothetical protein